MKRIKRSSAWRAFALSLIGCLLSGLPTPAALAQNNQDTPAPSGRRVLVNPDIRELLAQPAPVNPQTGGSANGSETFTGSSTGTSGAEKGPGPKPPAGGAGGGPSGFPWPGLPPITIQAPSNNNPNATAKEVEVPPLKGLEAHEGESRLKDRALVMHAQPAPTPDKIWTITNQNPQAGTHVPIGSTVTVTVEPSRVWTTVPKLIDLTVADAKRAVQAAMLGMASRNGDPSDADDTVADQQPPADTRVAAGSQVTVTWAPATTVVPKIERLTTAQAKIRAKNASLSLIVSGQPGVDGRLDRIEHQDPSPGTVVRKKTQVIATLALAQVPIVGLPPTLPDRAPVSVPGPTVIIDIPQPPPQGLPSPSPGPPASTPAPTPSSGPGTSTPFDEPSRSPVGAAAGLAALGLWIVLRYTKRIARRMRANHRPLPSVRFQVAARRDAGVQQSRPRAARLAQPTVGLRVRWTSTAVAQSASGHSGEEFDVRE